MAVAIAAARACGKYVGISGQAPSEYHEITQWMVEQGSGLILLNPVSVNPISQVVLTAAQRPKRRPNRSNGRRTRKQCLAGVGPS